MNWSIIAQKVRRTVSPIPPYGTGALAQGAPVTVSTYQRTTGALLAHWRTGAAKYGRSTVFTDDTFL